MGWLIFIVVFCLFAGLDPLRTNFGIGGDKFWIYVGICFLYYVLRLWWREYIARPNSSESRKSTREQVLTGETLPPLREIPHR